MAKEQITAQDITQFLEKYKYNEQKETTITRAIAEKWTFKELLCFIACDTMAFGRPINKSIENANAHSTSTKEELLDLWFGKQTEEYAII